MKGSLGSRAWFSSPDVLIALSYLSLFCLGELILQPWCVHSPSEVCREAGKQAKKELEGGEDKTHKLPTPSLNTLCPCHAIK